MSEAEVTTEVEEELLRELEALLEAESRDQIGSMYAGTAESGHDGGPYIWQERFHAAGADNYLRCIMAGNRSGKTRTGAAEVGVHLTGRYPDWWRGKRFDRAIECWVGSETNEASRDIVQKALLGPVGQIGTGWIPADAVDVKGVQYRQAGIPDVADLVRVRHVSGGWSECQFKTYEQGRRRWQGTAKDLIWLDEEPPADIFSEAITRTLDKQGSTILTFTPLMGMGEVVIKVLGGGDGIYLVNASWDDCPHLDVKAQEQLLAAYPEYERATRKSGQPMLGVGAVYPVQDEEIICDPLEIPNYWRRICGIDFGINHPAAAVWIAHDADTDTIYVYDAYKQANEAVPYHAAAIRRRGDWIPVAWPHDGMNRDKGSGVQLAEQYRESGVDILPFSARYDDEKGGGQPNEPVVNDILERMRTGRFKVFRTLNEWFEEKRMYHRNDRGVIVRERDDIMAATNYAVMMVRHAISQSSHQSMKRFAGVEQEPYDALGNFLRR
jgi:phage terminase large subunit-like protein